MRRGLRRRLPLCIVLAALAAFVAAGLLSSLALTTARYETTCGKLTAPVRVVLLTDLHGAKYGRDYEKLVSAVRAQAPDFIAMAGDFVNDGSPADIARLGGLIGQLSDIAPVYFSKGNTENDCADAADLAALETAGARVLDDDYADVELNGQSLRIGGMYAYAFFDYSDPSALEGNAAYGFLTDFTDTDRTTVLLCHRPDSFIFYDSAQHWGIDLILCGHTHGGLIRLPLIGSLYLPDQGFFPKYDKGLYDFGGSHMAISAGLAGHNGIPRFYDPPEVTVVDILP